MCSLGLCFKASYTTRIPKFFLLKNLSKKTHIGQASKKPLNHLKQVILNMSIAIEPYIF
jgi:hypothetical protein